MPSLVLAFLAGLVSILSPCVLPLLPLVFGAAAGAHRLGPLALACGLVVAYVAVGLVVATVGFEIGLDGDMFRRIAAVLMIAAGAILLLPAAQSRLATAAGPAVGRLSSRFERWSPRHPAGQFGVGLLLGAAWSPCVGPTLGAASALAMQGRDLGRVALTMGVFGVGAAIPLLLLGVVGGHLMVRWRDRLMTAGHGAKIALGVALLVAGVAVATGANKALERLLVEASPDWLNQLTTSF